MSFDPAALRRLAGSGQRPPKPATAGFLVRVGVAAGLAAALCDVVLLLVARAAGWLTEVDGAAIEPLAVVVVCVLTGFLAGLGAYVAARVTRRPSLWVAVVGAVLWLASIQGLQPAVLALHSVAAAWIVGWLTYAVRRGSHLLQM